MNEQTPHRRPPPAPPGNQRNLRHGLFTRSAIEARKQLREAERALRAAGGTPASVEDN
jgi:hypothetical protein